MLKVKYVSIFLLLLATGCAFSGDKSSDSGWSKGASQPRALLWGVDLRNCVFWCSVTMSVNESERSGGALNAGDITDSFAVGLPGLK